MSRHLKRTTPGAAPARPTLADHVGAKAARKLKARRSGTSGVWFGLGMMGLIGWSVAVPTLLGTALGLWLDQRYPGGRSWTLALLMGGLAIGCLNAWHWVSKEHQTMHGEQEDVLPGFYAVGAGQPLRLGLCLLGFLLARAVVLHVTRPAAALMGPPCA